MATADCRSLVGRLAADRLGLPRESGRVIVGARTPRLPVIETIQFSNFRVLEEATLPLSPFNVLIGPNGSGKTTALRALLAAGATARALEADAPPPVFADLARARARFSFSPALDGAQAELSFSETGVASLSVAGGREPAGGADAAPIRWLARSRDYVLDPAVLARTLPAGTEPVLERDGAGLAAVLEHIHRTDAERWRRLVEAFRRLMPEFADVHAGRTTDGRVAFSVVTVRGRNLQPASLSQGTLVLLALLAIVSAPERPSLICIEEIERGFHPRLLREVRDIFYRLSYPEECGESGPAVQVVATTHSPYVLDLFGDTPEDVILATKQDDVATFQRLSDVPGLDALLSEGRLGDLWYSGILGGVP